MYAVISVSDKRYMPLHSQDNRKKNCVPSNTMKRKKKIRKTTGSNDDVCKGNHKLVEKVTLNGKAKSSTPKGKNDFIFQLLLQPKTQYQDIYACNQIKKIQKLIMKEKKHVKLFTEVDVC